MMEETPRTALRDLDPSMLWVAYGYEPSPQSHVNPQSSRTPHAASRKAPSGYAYIFPKRDHVNIGIGYVLSYFRSEVDEAPYSLQRLFVDALRARGIVDGRSERRNFTPFLIPVGGPLRVPGRGRVLVAGDAGGFVNAFTAEGIYYAMVTGDLAAAAIAGSSAGENRHTLTERYRNACRCEVGAELRDSVLIQRHLFGDRRRIARIIRAAPRNPGITRVVLDYAIGRRSYRSARRHLLSRSPWLALKLLWQSAKGFAYI